MIRVELQDWEKLENIIVEVPWKLIVCAAMVIVVKIMDATVVLV